MAATAESDTTPFTPEEIRSAWVQAARLRTLPLAAAGSFIAAGVAAHEGAFRPGVFALMFIVSVLLQVIANFADDYGDLAHGLDDETRVGPKRGMQRGIITPAQMKRALVGMSALTFALGCALIAVAFWGGPAIGGETWIAASCFVVLGAVCIAAAILYTVGPHPYGYLGLGDIVSAFFFGIVAVVGGSFLYLHAFDPVAVLAGVALGLPVAAVMNINNMRDSAADAAKGKRTIANRLYARQSGLGPEAGERAMRSYHLTLIWCSVALFLVTVVLAGGITLRSLAGAVIVCLCARPLVSATYGVVRQPDHTKLDRFMAPTSMGTVLLALGATAALVLV